MANQDLETATEQTVELRAQVRRYLVENFLMGDEASMVGDRTSLVDSGTLDSTGVLEIVAFLDKRFAIKVEDAEVNRENLDSLEALVLCIRKRLPDPA